MRLSQGLLDNKYEEMQVPWDWLIKKKADSEGLGRGEKGKEKQDKKTMTLCSKMLCRKP